MDFDLLRQEQSQILETIFSATAIGSKPITEGFLKRIADDASLAEPFGVLGQNAVTLASKINFECPHPDIYRVYGGSLVTEDGQLGQELCDHIKAHRLLDEAGLGQTVEGMLRHSLQSILWSELYPLNQIQLSDSFHVRFEKSQVDRELFRSRKGTSIIFPASASKPLQAYYINQNPYCNEIELLKDSEPTFLQARLPIMAAYIDSVISSYHTSYNTESYYGFNPIGYLTASSEVDRLNDCNQKPIKAYPACLLQCTKKQEELIAFLESYPSNCHYPLFDHYRIVLPQHCDAFKLKNDEAVGVLIGERMGTAYFISYWMANEH